MAIASECALNRILAATLTLAIWTTLTASAKSTPRSDAEACYGASGTAAITACSRAIASGAFDKSVAALLLVHRAKAWTSFKGQEDNAILDYNQAIANDPRLAEAYHGRGNVHRSRGDFVTAIADYDKAIGIDPNFVYAYIGRALAYRAGSDIERAIADFNQALRLSPGLAFVYFHRGNAYEAKGAHRQAVADYDQAIRQNPKLTVALYGRGIARLNQGDAGGNADLQAAKAIKANIAEEFAGSGGSAAAARVPPPVAPPPAVAGPAPLAPATLAPATNCAAAETHWKSAEEIRTVTVYQDHLARFPNCDFATLAAARIQALKK